MNLIFAFLLAVIQLDGVTGDQLAAEAVFDANNVRLGDPLLLQIDFQGVADLANLHPPALSRHVDAKTWKVDDASAKTDTGRFIRRLTYRVRPLREGLLAFPALTFSYEQTRGRGTATFSTQPIPVHVKPGQQAALSGLEPAASDTRTLPDGILIRVAADLDDDTAFAWKKACAKPSEAAFAAFDFPEAKLNEAACATLAGNWARALKIYRRLEWRTGQTPEIERGLVAALACKTEGAVRELPVWRQVLRPVLRYALAGRLAVVAGVLAGFFALLYLCRRLIRALVCVAVIVGASAASGQGLFDEMDRMMQMHMQQMQQMMGTHGRARTIINGVEQEPVNPVVTVTTDRKDIRVGEPFSFILSIEHPKGCTLQIQNLSFSEEYGLVAEPRLEQLPRGTPKNPSNVVDRVSLKARYDVPMKTDLTVRLRGMATQRVEQRGMSWSSSQGFESVSAPLAFEVKPLPTDNQPASFAGAVGSGFVLRQSVDRKRVETNDVVAVRRTLTYEGVMPDGKDWVGVERRPGTVAWSEYFIADGRAAVPPAEVTYYDVKSRTYKKSTSNPCALTYVAADEAPAQHVAVDAGVTDEKGPVNVLRLRFYPSDAAPVIGTASGRPAVTEERGAWMRVDDGAHAGWVKKEDMR